MVLFGCKSDADIAPVVDPSEADIFGQPFNVGLIEVTHSTSDGKSKMRNGLRWLIYKLEQRQRKPLPCEIGDRHTDQVGREQRRLLALDLELEQQRYASSLLDDITSPDSDASSGGHRLMYRRSLGMTPADAEEDTSDKRSSSSSLQWMMKSPLRPTNMEETTTPIAKPRVNAKVDTIQNRSATSCLTLPLREIT